MVPLALMMVLVVLPLVLLVVLPSQLHLLAAACPNSSQRASQLEELPLVGWESTQLLLALLSSAYLHL